MTKVIFFCFMTLMSLLSSCGSSQRASQPIIIAEPGSYVCGAEQTESYLPLLKDKRVAVCANQTSLVGRKHLIDTLLSHGVEIVNIFSLEHGFRGSYADGALVESGVDIKTGIPVISLYTKSKKPEHDDLRKVDVLLFDIQDVGTRFYTYISALAYIMEACSVLGLPVVVLDRPNPNGFYVDGPVLDTAYRSFVGMHPVPLVYGMTIGEYALMILGEKWIPGGLPCNLTVIPLLGYDHNMIVKLPVKPSPNLPDWHSVYLYPSTALFEGTFISEGRGTERPFQLIGHPGLDLELTSIKKKYHTSFTPVSIPGASLHPKLEGQLCHGLDLGPVADSAMYSHSHFTLSYLIELYRALESPDDFFNGYFDKLAGNGELRKQIEMGMDENEIRSTWKEGLRKFRATRAKYLLYPDIKSD